MPGPRGEGDPALDENRLPLLFLKRLAPSIEIMWGPLGEGAPKVAWPVVGCVDCLETLGSFRFVGEADGSVLKPPSPVVFIVRSVLRIECKACDADVATLFYTSNRLRWCPRGLL